MLMEAVIFCQSFGILRPQLAQGHIHKFPPLRRTGTDDLQVLWGKENGAQHLPQGRGGLGRHAVDGDLPPLAPEGLDTADEFPVPAGDLSGDAEALRVKADQLPIPPGPG